MKILIWIGTFLAAYVLNSMLGMAMGFKLGYLLIYLVAFFAAKKFSNIYEDWDCRRKYKPQEESNQFEDATRITSVYELLNDSNILDYHYTTMILNGILIFENSNYYITENHQESDVEPIAKLQINLDRNTDKPEGKAVEVGGTLIIENGKPILQWAKIIEVED